MRTIFSIALLLTAVAWAQSDRGTITGTISDPAGAVVASAPIEFRNVATGAVYQAATSATGNYTMGQLPTGTYELSVTVPGFKKFVRQGLTVQVAQTLRIDVTLEVGNAAESVTVNEAVPLLKTESGEVSHNVTSDRIDNLPMLGIGSSQASSSGVRNPLVVVQFVPGSYFNAASTSTVRINGAPTNSQAMLIEGQDATNSLGQGAGAQTQASVDSIQEFAIQTSNYAAEFGQAGGGVFNMTIKSGTNQFHGTAYDYFVNEALNASTPFVNQKPLARRNDYGGTIGGPVWLPKIYNGHDKTFFFFNLEQFRESQGINTSVVTVPIADYRSGNFARALTGRSLGTDPLGRAILENGIYDPTTQRTAPSGQLVRDQFPGNVIPAGRLDPVALKVQALIPQPTRSGLALNASFPFNTDRFTYIPAVKIDHSLNTKAKLTFYWSWTNTLARFSNTTGGAEGLPQPISAAIGTFIDSHTERLSYDYSLSPTLLLHLGAGYVDNFLQAPPETTPYDVTAQLGLKGPFTPIAFPPMTGLCVTTPCSGQGGMNNMGSSGGSNSIMQKTTAVASLTWVKNNHTYKAGGTLKAEGFPQWNNLRTSGTYAFSSAQTGLPYLTNTTLGGGNVGFPYASFVLGLVDNGSISVPTKTRLGKSQYGFYVQDTWKVTRRFTLDYGLRYDYSQAEREQYGRLPNFSPTTPDPAAGGQPGTAIYEGNGPQQCNCIFTKNYPWAFGPRLGAAYQINMKTVFRAGFGIMYNGTDNNNRTTSSVGSNNPFSSPSFGQPAMVLGQGMPFTAQQIAWPNFSPGYYPIVGSLTGPPFVVDQNGGRPARQYMWSVGFQREIFRNLAVEANYVGNRGIWWQAITQVNYNALTPAALAARGININSPADQQLLISPLTSALAVSRGFKAPYTGFPTGSTVAQSLRPFPQFSAGLAPLWAPLGDTWYESLQVKVTKRFSRGLDFTYTFTKHKTLTIGAESDSPAGNSGQVNDVFNRPVNRDLSAYDQPMVSNVGLNYSTPKWGKNKILSYALMDWRVGVFLNYASGLPILAPVSTNNLNNMLFQSTFYSRVPGVPVFTQDLNCHCYDPNRTFVLNPAAWTNPPAGQFGTAAAYYNDYRQQRRPAENFGFGRNFRFTERISLDVRAEFTNIFNRTEVNSPTSTNALATQLKNTAGQTTGGFGYINVASVAGQPRQGSIVARIRF